MDAAFASIVDFVAANRELAPALVFLLALGETTALVSILIPSTALLVGVGALVAAGALDFTPVFLAAAAGALTGSTFSFWLGRRYGPAVAGMWPLNRDPQGLARSRDAFARWGTAAVFVGHFVGPLRSVAFLTAGFSAMRATAFQLANVPGAVAWAFLAPKSGELGGDALGAVLHGLGGA
jgi:membrane protein DedA with SNARE-associated domain